jgi:peptide/nickel transport system ATP-binding protein
MMRLQAEMGLAFLFISHDIAVVARISHPIAVMYLGEIVEIGPRASIIENPQHPYTRKLMAAAPTADPARRGFRLGISNGCSPFQIPFFCSLWLRINGLMEFLREKCSH